MGWLSRNNFSPSDYVQASDLNNLANDMRTWGGNVNGGGFTLSNVVLEGVSASSPVASVFGRTGAVVAVAGDYTAAQVTGAVPNTVQVIAGSGMSGGGALTGNVTLNAAVTSVFGRTGAVTLTPADLSGANAVLQTRNINTGAGLQGGGNLAADLNLSVIPGDPTQQIQFLQAGTVVSTRHGINFISGANVTVAVTDNSASGRVDVTVSSTGGGSGMVDPTTTKGDIIVRGPSLTSRLAVGTDGQTLIADSTQSLGVRWGAATGGGAVATVFGRTGAVVAVNGDYTAAQVTNAVDRSQTYSDATASLGWITGLNWSKILNPPTILVDPTTTKGDLIARGASISRLPVGADGSVLVADSTQSLGVRWGATAASIPAGQYAGDMLVWQQAGSWGLISAAGQPAAVGNVLTVQSVGASTKLIWQAPPPPKPTTYYVSGTQVNTSFGLNLIAGNNTTISGALDASGNWVDVTITAGGPTSGLSDPTTTKGDLIVRGAAQVTRLPIGTDGMVLQADSTMPLGIKWATPTGGGTGGAQTPWTSNIDAAGYTLSNIPMIQAPASNNNLILNAPGANGSISLQVGGGTMATVNQASGLISRGALTSNVNPTNSNPPAVFLTGTGTAQWSITGTAAPTTPGTNALTFQCQGQSAGVYVMNDLGRFGVGVATPAYTIDAAGDCNVSGLYRIAGSPLAAANVVNAVDQTASYANPAWIASLPWSKLTGVPGNVGLWQQGSAGAIYYNGGSVGIGTASPAAVLDVTGIIRTTDSVVTPASGAGLEFFYVKSSNIAFIEAYDRTAGAYRQLAFEGSPVVINRNSHANVLLCDSGGNVGIGTTTPSQTLSVVGAANFFSGAAGANLGVYLGRTATDATIAVPAAANQYASGAIAGDLVVRSETQSVILGSGGQGTLFVTHGNSVGVGVISPAAKFQVSDGANHSFMFLPGATNTIQSMNDTGSAWTPMTILTGGSNICLNPSQSGFVGIATATPGATLDIAGSSPANGARPSYPGLVLIDNYSTSLQATTGLEYQVRGDGGGSGWRLSASYATGGPSSTDFTFEAREGSASWTERMRIKQNGNVGIGTASPGAQLDIETLNPTDTPGANQLQVYGFSNTPLFGWRIGGGNNYIAFDTMWSAWVFSFAVQRNNGYIGIGKTNPGAPLDVVGNINVSGQYLVNGSPISTGITGVWGYQNQSNVCAAARPYINFGNGGSTSVTVTDSASSNWFTVQVTYTSDLRIKQNVTDLTGGMSVIDRLRPVAFEYNGAFGFEKGKTAVSVIAQELREVMPDAVYSVRQKLFPEDEEAVDVLCIDPPQIIAQLILAVKQLNARIAALEKKEN